MLGLEGSWSEWVVGGRMIEPVLWPCQCCCWLWLHFRLVVLCGGWGFMRLSSLWVGLWHICLPCIRPCLLCM